MKNLALGAVGVVLLSAISAFSYSGGWAIVKVAKIPDAWVVGKPLQLTWQVRQHGVTRLGGLHTTIEARSGTKVVRATPWEIESEGQKGYRANLVFPERGDWQVT